MNLEVYVGPNAGTGPLDTYRRMVDDDSARVITTSWGQCEAQLTTADVQAEASIFQQAIAQGQTVVAAAGDEGSEDCYLFPSSQDTRLAVDDPAGQPWVTTVGGTTIEALGPAPVESVWNTGLFAGTGGGGSSATWTMPSWQLGPGVQSVYTKAQDDFTGASPCPVSSGPGTVSCREVPDVAGDADPRTGMAAFCSCFGGGWAKIGGTSMSAPLWAAIAALADQGQPSSVGFLNPALYQAQCQASPPFNDVTVGNDQPLGSAPSDPPHLPPGPYYPATAGYDLATGLGTPVAAALVSWLRAPPPGTCPEVSGISASSGPAGGGTVVTVSGSNLSGVDEVDFGDGNPAVIDAVTPTSVTVTSPASPTGGWATADVLVKSGDDVLGFDGSTPFTYLGPRGYWTVASDGGVFTFGSMGFYGSMGGKPLAAPIVGMAATPSSRGYWLVASDGGVFAFGDAGFHGSTGAIHLTKPVVGMAATPDGGGYWLVASDGGVFAFGDAGFYGSTGAIHLDQAGGGHGRHPRRRRVLAGGLRRRGVRLRRRRLLRIDGRHPPDQAGGGHGRHPRRRRVLAGGLRRRGLRLRRRRLLRIDGRHPPDQAGGGHGRHPRRGRVLAGGLRRRGLRLRGTLRRVLRLHRRHPSRPSRWWASARPEAEGAVG